MWLRVFQTEILIDGLSPGSNLTQFFHKFKFNIPELNFDNNILATTYVVWNILVGNKFCPKYILCETAIVEIIFPWSDRLFGTILSERPVLETIFVWDNVCVKRFCVKRSPCGNFGIAMHFCLKWFLVRVFNLLSARLFFLVSNCTFFVFLTMPIFVVSDYGVQFFCFFFFFLFFILQSMDYYNAGVYIRMQTIYFFGWVRFSRMNNFQIFH